MVYVSGGTQLIDAQKVFKHLGLAEGMAVADLGCGAAGHYTIPAGRLVGSKGIVYAVDILKSVLQEVSTRARLEAVNNIKTVWSNLEIYGATKIPANSLDVTMLINIMFQSKRRAEIMKEAKRLLKKGGKMLVADWKKTSAPFGPPTVDRVPPEAIKKYAQYLKLKLVDEFPAGKFHYGLIFVKPHTSK